MEFFKKKEATDQYLGGAEGSWNKQISKAPGSEIPDLPVWNPHGTIEKDDAAARDIAKKQSTSSILKKIGSFRKSKSADKMVLTGGIGDISIRTNHNNIGFGSQPEEHTSHDFKSNESFANPIPQQHSASLPASKPSPAFVPQLYKSPAASNPYPAPAPHRYTAPLPVSNVAKHELAAPRDTVSNVWFEEQQSNHPTSPSPPVPGKAVECIGEILEGGGARTTPDREQVKLFLAEAQGVNVDSLGNMLRNSLTEQCSWQVQSKSLFLIEALLKEEALSKTYTEYFRENHLEIITLCSASKVSLQTKAMKIRRALGIKVQHGDLSEDQQQPAQSPESLLLFAPQPSETEPEPSPSSAQPQPAPSATDPSISGIFAGLANKTHISTQPRPIQQASQQPSEEPSPHPLLPPAPQVESGADLLPSPCLQDGQSPSANLDLFTGLSVSPSSTNNREENDGVTAVQPSASENVDQAQYANQQILGLFNAPMMPQQQHQPFSQPQPKSSFAFMNMA